MIQQIKKFIFELLPVSTQRNMILRKTGSVLLKDIKVTPTVRFSYNLPPKAKIWFERFSTEYGHEPFITKFYENYLRNDDVVFDVGVQMGFFPSLISTLNPNVAIHGFETEWFSFHYLMMNKAINDKNNKWQMNHCFVSETTKQENGLNFVSIIDYCKKNNVVPTIFQMDVDGFEGDILNGAKNLLENNVTEFLIEVHPQDLITKKGSNVREFLKIIDANKFDIRYLPDLRQNNTNWTLDLGEVDLNEEFYLYAAPKGKARF